MRHIRAISLDLDDTLWEIEPVIKRAEEALWLWLDEHYPRIRKHWTPQALIELRMAITSDYPERAHDLRFLRKRVLSIMATKAGYSDDLVDPAFSVFDKHRNTVDLYPDVEAALQWFSAHFTVIATTNGNANAATNRANFV